MHIKLQICIMYAYFSKTIVCTTLHIFTVLTKVIVQKMVAINYTHFCSKYVSCMLHYLGKQSSNAQERNYCLQNNG